MDELQPGKPIDRRTETMRARSARSHLGDLEFFAARVIARLTGARTVIQDDNSSPAMPDIRIEYADGLTAFAEVVVDIEPVYSATVAEVRRLGEIAVPGLGRMWWVTVSATTQLKDLRRQLSDLLAELGRRGHLFEVVAFEQQLTMHADPVVRELAALGVVELISRASRMPDEEQILLHAEGTGGLAKIDWPAFHQWLRSYLYAPDRADVRAKLAGTGVAERHAFVFLSFSSPWPAWHTLSRDYRDLPPIPPDLPAEITHVWVWAYPTGRCIAWAPADGWFEPRHRWTTD